MTTDNYNMLEVIESFPAQCMAALELTKGLSVPKKINNIVIAGMGGSGIAGDILSAYMLDKGSRIPVYVVKDYLTPEFTDANSLVFAVSYSGNTEETLSAYRDAVNKKAHIIGVASGGELGRIHNKVIKVPSGIQPRAALGFLFFPILGVLSNAKIIKVDIREIQENLDVLGKTEYYRNLGKDISKKIGERTPLIYASEKFGAAAYRWKCQFNENSKIQAFSNVFSELNHNEIVGYTTTKKERFIPIFLRDGKDSERIKKRMDTTKKIISQKADVIEVNSLGEYFLTRLFSLIHIADYASYYLAIDNGIDPTPVAVIENLKNELK